MSADDPSLQFPLHVSTEDEEFVIEKEGDDPTSPPGSHFDGTASVLIFVVKFVCYLEILDH
jgi:hypothetical protein